MASVSATIWSQPTQRNNSYMQAASQGYQSARIAPASRNMDRAEAEIEILEKFLGR